MDVCTTIVVHCQTVIVVHAAMMVKPDKIPALAKALTAEAHKQGRTSYWLKQESGIPLSTAQRLLAGDLNPTASTIEAVAKALGLTIKVEKSEA